MKEEVKTSNEFDALVQSIKKANMSHLDRIDIMMALHDYISASVKNILDTANSI